MSRRRSSTDWAFSRTAMKRPAAVIGLEDKVDKRTIYNRKRALMALQRRISRKRNGRLIGHEFPVLIEGPSQETELLWEARLPTQAPEIDGVCYINDFGEAGAARPGEMRRLRVTEAHDYDLVGELTDLPEQSFSKARETVSNPFPILQASASSRSQRDTCPLNEGFRWQPQRYVALFAEKKSSLTIRRCRFAASVVE